MLAQTARSVPEDGADVPPRTYRFALRTVLRGSLETAIPIEAAKPYDVSVAVVDGEGRPTPAQIFVLDPSTGLRGADRAVGGGGPGRHRPGRRALADPAGQDRSGPARRGADDVRPHTLRRTFASLALAGGRDPRWVMGQIGHTDARLTLSVYAQVVQRQSPDRALVWRFMRFPDEPDGEPFGPTNGPMGVSHRAQPTERIGIS
jgi:hypothetical protein